MPLTRKQRELLELMSGRRGEGARKREIKAVKRTLRRYKVGVIDELMKEVMDADRYNGTRELVSAYLILLAQRVTISEVSDFMDPRLQRSAAKKIGNLLKRHAADEAKRLPALTHQRELLALTMRGGDEFSEVRGRDEAPAATPAIEGRREPVHDARPGDPGWGQGLLDEEPRAPGDQ